MLFMSQLPVLEFSQVSGFFRTALHQILLETHSIADIIPNHLYPLSSDSTLLLRRARDENGCSLTSFWFMAHLSFLAIEPDSPVV